MNRVADLVLSPGAERPENFTRQQVLLTKVKKLLDVVREDPYRDPPPVKQLRGDLKGKFSRRIDHKHRLVYELRGSAPDTDYEGVIYVERMWSHYGD